MSSAHKTINHDEIRAWAEKNNGRPSCVRGTGKGDDPGMLRLDFDEPDEGLEEISWDTWLTWFDRNELALLHSDDSRFNKLVSRGDMEDETASSGSETRSQGDRIGEASPARPSPQGSGEGDDLKAREYRDSKGELHHHTHTYAQQHRGS